MCLVNVTSGAGAGDWADTSPAVVNPKDTSATIPKKNRFIRRRLRPNRAIVNAAPALSEVEGCKVPGLLRSKG